MIAAVAAVIAWAVKRYYSTENGRRVIDAAVQIRSGHATLAEKLVLNHANQVEGSGVLGELDTPLALTLRDALTLMVVLSDNTATNMVLERITPDAVNRYLDGIGIRTTRSLRKIRGDGSQLHPRVTQELLVRDPQAAQVLVTFELPCPLDNRPRILVAEERQSEYHQTPILAVLIRPGRATVELLRESQSTPCPPASTRPPASGPGCSPSPGRWQEAPPQSA